MKKAKSRKISRKLAAGLLASTFLVGSVAGCGQQGSSTSSTTASVASANVVTAKEAIPFKDTFEFTFLGAMWSPYSADMTDITNEIQRVTNTKIKFEWTATETFQDKLSTILASGTLPDIINYGTVKTALNTLVDQGAVVALDDLLAKNAPDYLKAVGDDAGPFTKFASDGKVYDVKSIFDYSPIYTYMVRSDWVKNVGKQIPTTWDGWVDLWKAFRDQDANKDGNADNEIPFGSYSDLRSLAYICGIQKSGNFAVDSKGNYSILSEHPNYQLFLDTARMLYTENLLDPEYQTRKKDADMFSVMDNNTCGTVYVAAERAKLSTQVNADVDKNALWSSIVPIQGPKGDQLVAARPKFSSGACITVSAQDSGKAEKLTQFLNWLYSEDGTRLLNYGIEGKHYTMKDGKPVLNTPYINGFTDARKAGLISQVLPLNWQAENYQQILLQGKSYNDLDSASKSFVDGLTINTKYYYQAAPTFSTPTVVESGVSLFEKLDILRDNYVTSKITKDEYNAQYAQLKAAGLDKINQEVKEAYAVVK